MRIWLGMLFLLLSCKQENKVELYETHVLCVYWTDFAEKEFETPAISYKLRITINSDINKSNFLLQDTIGEVAYPLKRLKQIQKEGFSILGLSLDSKYMQQFFDKKINVKDNCYTSELKNLSEASHILMITKGDTTLISKAMTHNFYIGPRDKK